MDSARDHQSASRMSDHLAGLKATLRTEIDGQTCYDRFKELGFHYGPTFQAIEHVWLGDAGALSRIKVSVPVADLDGYHLHPVILDACFQMLLALTLDSENRERLGSFLPVGARSVRVNGRPEGEMWCHAWFTEQSPQAIAADIILMREDGTVLVEVRDFRAQSLSNMQLSGGSSSIDSWLYEAKWYEMPRATEPGAPAPAQTSGVWAIFADQGGLGAELAARIEGQGQKAVLIFAGSSYKCDGPQRYTIRPSEADDYNRLFADIARAEGEPCSAIVHLWAIDTDPLREPTQELLKAEQEKNVYAIRRVIQALDQHGQTPRLWLVTRGAQPVGKELTAGALSQATLWGMGRVLHQESLTLQAALIDLDPEALACDADMLFAELQAPDDEDQLAFRDGRRWAIRLQPMPRKETVLPHYFRPDAAYLITGGFGALGMLVARWLARSGARRLILMARSAIPPRAQWNALAEDHPQAANIAFIRELEGMGVSVHVAAVDVVDQAALKQFLDDYRREGWPPLRGVIHSAGIVRDQVLTRMDQATFEAVLHPKMLGGWNLHECFKDTELDFFVLFSSISALVVTVGQSNYASGNAFLDALAHYRRGLGLPAISINWGPWAIGMIAQLNLESLYAQRGIDVILPDHGMQILGHLMGRNPVQGMVVSANWRTVVDSYAIVPRLVVHLATSDESAEAQEGVQLSIKDRLAQVSADERIELLASHCHDAVSRVLRIDSSRLDVETPLNTIGLDSMIAVELRIRLEKSLGAAPTVVEMLRGMSIRNLAQNIARSVEVNLSATVADNEQGEENLEDMLADVDEATLAQLLESIEPQQPVPAGSN